MAPRTAKRRSEPQEYTSDDGFVAQDTDPSDRPTKRSKTTSSSSRAKPTTNGGTLTDSDGNPYWELSTMRRVTISEFKGMKMVNVREYYEKDGKDLPGKKGISMTLEQYSTFIDILPQIEAALKKQGADVPRPVYDDAAGADGEEEGDEKVAADGKGKEDKADEEEEEVVVEEEKKPAKKTRNDKRSNIEATSDEDEDD